MASTYKSNMRPAGKSIVRVCIASPSTKTSIQLRFSLTARMRPAAFSIVAINSSPSVVIGRNRSRGEQNLRGADGFARGSTRQGVAHNDFVRHFEVGQVGAQKRQQLLLVELSARTRHYRRPDHLAAFAVWNGENDIFLHARKRVDQVFHLGGINIE